MPSEEVEPARFTERELSEAVRDQLGGVTGAPAVIWAWQGSEIVLYPDSAEVTVTPGQLDVLEPEPRAGEVPEQAAGGF